MSILTQGPCCQSNETSGSGGLKLHFCFQATGNSDFITLKVIRPTLADPLIEECLDFSQGIIDCLDDTCLEINGESIKVLKPKKLKITWKWNPYNKHSPKPKLGIKRCFGDQEIVLPCSLYRPNPIFDMQPDHIERTAVEHFNAGDEIKFCAIASPEWYGTPAYQNIYWFDLTIECV